ncbi:MAG: sulfatase [Acidobacteria bacterium]|nr:sulfatase [Acidobacteriota bacterium]
MNEISRRRMIMAGTGTTLFPLFQVTSGLADAVDKRPNILLALADDWGWPHAPQYGDRVVKTPVFERIASEGVLFTQAHCATPSCTPSRAAILTGQTPHRLEEGGNLWGFLPSKFPVYPDMLKQSGYHVGFTRKGWGPGSLEGSGRARNPAGPQFKDFETFFREKPAGKPFCFWFGSTDPHRPYEAGSGLASGMNLRDVQVPPFLPDTPEVRGDILDYYFEVQRFDRETGEMLKLLDAAGELDNTLVVMTGDNGMPFPRAKANLYGYGTHQPLAIRWPFRVERSRVVDEFVSFTDFAPTFLEAAGLKPSREMTGISLLGLLTGRTARHREMVFLERERHANVRRGDLSYPARAVRTREFLYIRNLRPQRWPAGDPEKYIAVGPFGDVDGSPTKDVILNRREEPAMSRFFRLAFDKRPAEELYDVRREPGELNNVADRPEYAPAKKKLRAMLDRWMKETRDPRAVSEDDPWDHYPYFGDRPQGKV